MKLAVAGLLTMLAAVPVADAAPVRCDVTSRLARASKVPKPVVPRFAAGPLQDRDPYNATQLSASANFNIRWRMATPTAAQLAAIHDELERSFTKFTTTFGQTVPTGMETYKLNVYISTGPSDTPAIDFDGGYADLDPQGYPYLVLSSGLLADEVFLRNTAAHELYHDFQFATGAYMSDASAWWWESTAEWAAQEMMPDEPYAYYFGGAYALTEELAIFHYGDPFGTDDLAGVHQYGAAAFPQYFTDTRGDLSLVPATWQSPGDDATTAFLARIGSSPDDIADKFAEFAAHMAVLDLPRRSVLEPMVAEYESAYPSRKRIDAIVPAIGLDWTASPATKELRAYGFHTYELTKPADGILRVEIDPTSDTARFRATLVRQTGSAYSYTAVPAGGLQATLGGDESKAWLVVSVADDTRSMTTTFPYRYRVNGPGQTVGPDEPMPDDEVADSGGCSTSNTTSSIGLGLALLGLVVRRRRAI